MKLEVTSGVGAVSVVVGCADECDVWRVEYDAIVPNEPEYALVGEAESFDQLRALIACAEPEGSEIRKRVEDLLIRVSDLFDEWQATLDSQERR